ncbi:MAG: hypothetical protein JO069_16560 [Verrucomicrobia bacterium]|nr:hypothetical protein [Verrucomicrobiota bacterium]
MLNRFVLFLAALMAVNAWADSTIPLDYIPPRVRRAVQRFVPGARPVKAEIANDEDWGPKYKIEYLREGHTGKIQVSERGRLLDVDEDINSDQVPPYIRRIAGRESRGGFFRKGHLEERRGQLVYKLEYSFGESNAKVELTIAQDGTLLDRDYD